jgi:hypothetical protein
MITLIIFGFWYCGGGVFQEVVFLVSSIISLNFKKVLPYMIAPPAYLV